MNKSEFIHKVAEKTEMSRAAAARVVDAIFDAATGAVSEAVHAAGSLTIPGFGKFTRKTRAARTGRNPRTGAEIEIPERVSVSFAPGGALREQRPSGRRSTAKAAGTASTTGASAPRKRASSASAKSTSTGTTRSSAAKETGRSTAAKGGAKSTAAKSTAAKSTTAKSTAAKSTGTKGGAAKSGGKSTAKGGARA